MVRKTTLGLIRSSLCAYCSSKFFCFFAFFDVTIVLESYPFQPENFFLPFCLGKDVYGAGLLGSLAYMRMLGKTVDSMADGAKGLIKGAVGQPRLLVPVVLVMIYDRWNEILVPEYGFMHLELIPMLVGFFTYKIATFFQAIEDTLTVSGEKRQA
ncbi:unnamed protein product [Coffea canephora]|uniref:CGL160/ATPI domain-containing protein n=1 Tax=Coffea canephora TaxID=49390 RepID=A0A068V5Y2_COFCA|nr:unnamed protein product [Coffea canephora]